MEIIPSPGTEIKNWKEMEERIVLVKPFAKTIHIDIVDGVFAPNTTFSDASDFKKYSNDVFFEVHLMVDNPIAHLQKWADAGFKRFIGQIERMTDIEEFVRQAKLSGEVGLAFDGPTNITRLENITLSQVDCVLVMAISAGFSGQKFQAEQLEKVRELKIKYPNLPVEMDGGLNENTIVEAKNVGVDRFVVTSALYNSHDLKKTFENLTSLIK